MTASVIGAVILWLIIVIIAVAVAAYLLNWLYYRSTKQVAFVRTGFGGETVVINGGALVLPIVHDVTPVNLNVVRIPASCVKEAAVITSDRMRVDIEAEFFVRVSQQREAVATAASTLGRRTVAPEQLGELLSGKFIGALRSVAAEMTLDEMHEARANLVAKVESRALEALAKNGLELESVAITNLDQTKLEFFNPANRFDAEGMTQLIETIEGRRKLRNDIEQAAMVAIRARNLEAEKETLKIEQESENSRLAQERELDASRAEQKAAIERARAVKEAEAEQSKIAGDQATREREIARRIALLQKQAEESESQILTEQARARAAAAEEHVATARETAAAERAAAVERVAAKKDAEAAKIRALADKIVAEVAAEAQRLHNENENMLSEDARRSILRAKLLDRIEGIVRQTVKPLKNIDGIKILHVDGLAGAAGNHRSPTDEVIESALRYRVQAPLIDELMKEIGVENANVAKMGDIFRAAKDAQSIAKESADAVETVEQSPPQKEDS